MNIQIKSIKNYEGLYEISNDGRVFSYQRKYRKELKPRVHRDGYLRVVLYKDGKDKSCQIHRLVAFAFLSNLENKPQVNHKDGNKKNNNYWNLEWVTLSENRKHSFKLGLQRGRRGEESHFAKLNENNILWIRKMHDNKIYPQTYLAKKFNVSDATISLIVNKINWRYI